MSAEFEHALAFVLANEGGWSDNPADPGGATMCGISLRFLRELPPEALRKYGIFKAPDALMPEDVKELQPAQISMIYHDEFWLKAHLDAFALKIEWPSISAYVLDMCVNHGISQGIKILQRAIWAHYLKREWAGIIDDGILGEKTMQELDVIDSGTFMPVLAAERAGFMRLLCAIHPKDKEFFDGWLDRCYRF